MDVFALKKGKEYKITVDNFEKLTKKEFPYCKVNKQNKLRFFAVCPECGNPVQIINLYFDEMRQENTGIISTYAKHTSSHVDGFPFWNRIEKENCSLYNPTPLGNEEIRTNTPYSEEIKELIIKYKEEILKDIKEIIGINVSVKYLERVYNVFLGSKAYNYKAVNKYNIPYSLLYYQPSTSIYYQYIRKSKIGDLIHDAINSNSIFLNLQQIVR